MLKRAIGRGCRAAPATKSTAQQPDQRTTSNVGTQRSGTTRQLEVQEEIILRLVHVDNRHPNAAARSRRSGRRTTEEAVEQPVHLALDISEGLPSLHEGPERTPTLHRHGRSSLLFGHRQPPCWPKFN